MTPPGASGRVVLLLRGINVGGRRRVPMADLREVAASIGFERPRTHLASGNLVVESASPPQEAAPRLEGALLDRFGFAVDVVARAGTAWRSYLADGPFGSEAAAHPERVLLVLSNAAQVAGADGVAARARGGELVRVVGDALWIYYAAGAGSTRITPASLDAAFGAPATSRNWRTVEAIADLVDA